MRFDFLGKIGEFSRKDGKVAFGLKLGFCGGLGANKEGSGKYEDSALGRCLESRELFW